MRIIENHMRITEDHMLVPSRALNTTWAAMGILVGCVGIHGGIYENH